MWVIQIIFAVVVKMQKLKNELELIIWHNIVVKRFCQQSVGALIPISSGFLTMLFRR